MHQATGQIYSHEPYNNDYRPGKSSCAMASALQFVYIIYIYTPEYGGIYGYILCSLGWPWSEIVSKNWRTQTNHAYQIYRDIYPYYLLQWVHKYMVRRVAVYRSEAGNCHSAGSYCKVWSVIEMMMSGLSIQSFELFGTIIWQPGDWLLSCCMAILSTFGPYSVLWVQWTNLLNIRPHTD